MQALRAKGDCFVNIKQENGISRLSDMRMSGCIKVFFTREPSRVDAILVNSAGGLTGGDRITAEIHLEAGAKAAVTTQAAERAYCSTDNHADVFSTLKVGSGASLFWLPQELILFDGAALSRRLHCDLAEDAQLVLVEPVIFGRTMMGEELSDIWFSDHIMIDRSGAPLYRDATRLSGGMKDVLARCAVAGGAGAMASLVCVGPDAEAQYTFALRILDSTAGASLLQPDVLILRILAQDGFELRRSLLPILDRLTNDTLPASWRL
ncbi:MAG: urease accessory protein UreD [Pseudomonadota bacterium]